MDNQNPQSSIDQQVIGQASSPPPKKINKPLIFSLAVLSLILLVILAQAGLFYLKLQSANENDKRKVQEALQKAMDTTSPTPPPASLSFNTKSGVLARIPSDCQDMRGYDFVFSPNGKRVAFICETSNGMSVYVDGQKEKEYDAIESLTFSPDSNHVAYIATTGLKNFQRTEATLSFAVQDSQEQKKYEVVKDLVFSPDSSKIVYAVGIGQYFQAGNLDGYDTTKQMMVVVGAKEGKVYDGDLPIDNPTLSPYYTTVFSGDGKSFAYQAIKNGKQIIIFNDQEIVKHPYQTNPYFVPGTNQLGYTAYLTQDDWNFARNAIQVIGDKEQKGDEPIFSPSGKILGYLGKTKNKAFLTINGTSGKQYDFLNPSYISASVDGRIAYYANNYQVKGAYVIDNNELTGYPVAKTLASRPVFSPDGKLLALIEYHGETDSSGYLHLYDGTKVETKASIYGLFPQNISNDPTPPVFSPDGKYIGYGIKKENELLWQAIKL